MNQQLIDMLDIGLLAVLALVLAGIIGSLLAVRRR